MRVSVLIPTTGRRADWLDVAIASARNQVDAPEVIVEHDLTGTGQSATLNRAFARSTGDWITVCHDDDFYVRTDATALLLAQARMHPEAGAVYSLPQYVTTDGIAGPTPPRLSQWMTKHPRVRWGSFPDGLHMHGTGVLYRRDWWTRVGGWDETLPACEEYEFHLRLLYQGCVFLGLPVATMAYRHHAGQKSARRVGTIGRTSARRQEVQRRIRARYRAALQESA